MYDTAAHDVVKRAAQLEGFSYEDARALEWRSALVPSSVLVYSG